MLPRRAAGRWSVATAVAALCCSFVLAGCPKDPYDADTWIEKLDDPSEAERAITELQRLRDPKAIKPLADTYRKTHSARVLRVIIDLADGHVDEDEPDKNVEPAWEPAVPVLVEAVEEFDVGDQRSIENAVEAANALGSAGDSSTVQTLINAANKKLPKLSPGQRVRLAAIKSLGQFGKEPRAVDALIKVLEADAEDQSINLFGAAAIALGESSSPKAVIPLLKTMYKVPPLYQQTRRALISVGKPVIPELIKIFEGKHDEINALAKEYKFNVDCKSGIGPETKCQAPTNLEFKAASLLADMNAREAIPLFIAELKDRPLPAFFEQGIPGPTQHSAVLDGLRKLVAKEAADDVWAYINDGGTDDSIKPLAVDVYSYLTSKTAALDTLAKIMQDDGEEQQLRLVSGMAYGRLVDSEGQLGPIKNMVKRFTDAAEKAEKEAAPLVKSWEKVNKEKEELEAQILKASAEDEKKKLQAKLDKMMPAFDEKTQTKSAAEGKAFDYRAFQRTFEQNLVRAKIGLLCKGEPKCLADVLGKSPEDIAKMMKGDISDIKDWTSEQKEQLKTAAVERALIDLVKMGEKARPVVDQVLEHTGSTDRITRQGALLFLMQAAELPCTKCVTKLDSVIEEQKDQSTLAALTVETEAVRNYFTWAGK